MPIAALIMAALLSGCVSAPSQSPKACYKNEYILMRHGESFPSREQRLNTKFSEGAKPENGLTELGKQQVLDSANAWISKNNLKIVITYSPYSRTRQTAELLRKELSKKESVASFEENFGLMERGFGNYDGQRPAKLIAEHVHLLDSRSSENTVEDVESTTAVEKRMLSVVEKFEQESKVDGSAKAVFLVSHGDPLLILKNKAEGRDTKEFSKIPFFTTAEMRLLGNRCYDSGD